MKKLFTTFFVAFATLVFGQSPETFNTSGTWVCPMGVTSVDVECWGAGGGGGAADVASGTSFKGGGGGGGGSYVKKVSVAVVPGTTYTITVGVGGAGGTNATNGGRVSGTPGGKSEFSGGVVTPITASGGTPGTGGNSQRATGVGGVLGGVYQYNLTAGGTSFYTNGTTTFTYSGGGGSAAGATSAIVGGGTGAVQFVVPTGMGTGYTSAPTVTVNSSNTPTAGSGATVTALVNPNINSAGATVTTLGANGGQGVQQLNSRGTGTGTWASGGTTITFTVALANTTSVVGAYITGTGITLGTKVTAVSGTAIGQTITLDAPTTAAATGAAFTMFKLTGTVGGAGGTGGNGGAGGAATGNTYDATFAVGNNGTAPGGGGSGAISETGTIAGGAGADGRIVLTYTSLPIELSRFDVKNAQNKAILTWTTASEKSNARFDIEQSTNGTDFQIIGEMKGNGSTNSVSNYNFEHATPSVGINYYRLKQVDFDGTATLSPVKSVFFGKNGSVVKTTLVQDRLDVFVGNEVSTPLSIFNIAGQQVLSAKIQGQQSLDVSSLPAGLYFLNIDAAGVRTSTKFVKQ